METVTLWKDIFDASEKALTSIAIVLGAGVAYYKFLRGRIFHPRLEITISSSLLRISTSQFLKVTATFKNTGASKIHFDLVDSVLEISASHDTFKGIVKSVEWTFQAGLDLSPKHEWIEPGETVQQQWLVTLPPDMRSSAFLSELTVAGGDTTWYAHTIVERLPLVLSKSSNLQNN